MISRLFCSFFKKHSGPARLQFLSGSLIAPPNSSHLSQQPPHGLHPNQMERRNIEGLSEDYQLLEDFNGAVLAGKSSEYGVQFVTWERMDAVQATADELAQQITDLQEQAQESAELASDIQEQNQRLLSWAEMYDSASQKEKRMVASYIIKAVTLTRGYGIQVEFNISEAQYLNGMEMG